MLLTTQKTEHIPDSLYGHLQAIDDIDVRNDIPLSSLTTMGVGGPVLAAVDVKTIAALKQILHTLAICGIPWRIIGRGSNIVCGDNGWQGCVLRLSGEFLAIDKAGDSIDENRDHVTISAGAGVMLPQLFGWCLKQAMAGVEFLAGIPGTVGGAVAMNAGAWGSEVANILKSVTLLVPDGEIQTIDRDALSFSYRKWHGPKGALVLKASFCLTKDTKENIRAKSQELLDRRRHRQPLSLASSGSFFKNPDGMSAGQLIDTAGLKGLKKGGAMVSHEHANFIVNTGDASADDIIALMHEIQDKVHQRFSVHLEPEVHFLACSPEQKEVA